jgi:hypothetical protein
MFDVVIVKHGEIAERKSELMVVSAESNGRRRRRG